MGFSNGYDAGYDDAKAELMPKIKALEAQVASGGGPGSNGQPGSSAQDTRPLPPYRSIMMFAAHKDSNITRELAYGDIPCVYGTITGYFDPSRGDRLEILIDDQQNPIEGDLPSWDCTAYTTVLTEPYNGAQIGSLVVCFDNPEAMTETDFRGIFENTPLSEDLYMYARLTIDGVTYTTVDPIFYSNK